MANNKIETKQPYTKPKLHNYGNLRDVTLDGDKSGGDDFANFDFTREGRRGSGRGARR